MKQRQVRFWGAMAGVVAAGIVIARFWISSPEEVPHVRTGDPNAQFGPALQQEVLANAAVNPLAAPLDSRAATPDTNAAAAEANTFTPFADWFSRYQQETDAASKARLEAEGEALALQRREAMARLIEQDPQRALEEALSFGQRQQLPESIARHLE